MIHMQDLNVRVFNLMSRTNQTIFIEWHEKCKCECRLDAIICNVIWIEINVDVNVKN